MFDNMSDIEFRGGVCGGTRWNIPATAPFGFSPCPNLETFDWDMKGIFATSSIDVHENDACVIPDGQIVAGTGAMEDWGQTFNVHGGGGGGRTNHQSQIQLQERTIMMSPRLSNNLHDPRQENISSLQPFKSYSLEDSNMINNTTTTQHDMTFDTPIKISYGLSSELLQTLFEDDDEDLIHESIFENRPLPINYPRANNSRPIPKRPFDPLCLISDQAPPLWNSSSVASLNDIRANNFFPKVTAKKVANEVSHGATWSSTTVKSQCDRQPLKRSKIETPSPLPSFKVRKEKLGDRITALQQLVSPFGKTDTASVLHEAIDYIKFLHNQVNVLSSPYSKNRNDKNMTNESSYVVEEGEDNNLKQDLKSRGLCLVPLTSTIPVAIETTRAADFWTPNFGVGFRS